MKLPNGNQVNRQQIIEKLITYALNIEHQDGQHKARLFQSKLGISLETKEILVDALITAAANEPIAFMSASQYGQKYVLDFQLVTDIGMSKVRSAWIIRLDENYPRLTTVYPID
jgi:hypothetical protein